MTEIIIESIQQKIYLIRRQKVMLDSDLAELYGVSTKVLNQAVKRNAKRFPSDFMIQLKSSEYESLRSQFVTLKQGRGRHRKYLPYVFTEQGVAMLSSVLNSEQAIQVNIAIMRVFVQLRKTLLTHKVFARKLSTLEKRIEKQDEKIYSIFEAINSLMAPPGKKQRKIGFKREME
jgi:phage regulator Rha-like protein